MLSRGEKEKEKKKKKKPHDKYSEFQLNSQL